MKKADLFVCVTNIQWVNYIQNVTFPQARVPITASIKSEFLYVAYSDFLKRSVSHAASNYYVRGRAPLYRLICNNVAIR